jgi:hypothetical protein
MAQYRCTLHLECNGKGWSETYYQTNSSLDQAKDAWIELLTARMKLSGSMVKTKAIRLGIIGQPRAVLSMTPIAPYIQGTAVIGAAAPKVNLVADAVLIELQSQLGLKNKKFLRGLPDECFDSDRFVGSEDFDANFFGGPASYRGILTNGTWVTRTKNPAAPPAHIYTIIQDLAIISATIRKPGRPFGQARGRRATPASA